MYIKIYFFSLTQSHYFRKVVFTLDMFFAYSWDGWKKLCN